MSIKIAKEDIENEMDSMKRIIDAIDDNEINHDEIKQNYVKLHWAINQHQQHLFRINHYVTKRIKEL